MTGVLISVAVASAIAQPSLNLRTLVVEALKNNREILVAQKRYEAAAQRPRQAGALPDPTLSVGYESSGNPLPGATARFAPSERWRLTRRDSRGFTRKCPVGSRRSMSISTERS